MAVFLLTRGITSQKTNIIKVNLGKPYILKHYSNIHGYAATEVTLTMIRIALSQLEVIPGRPDLNTATMMALIEKARSQQAHIIIFPEMAIPGYLLGDTWEQRAYLRECEEFGRQVIAASTGLSVIFGNVGVDWEKRGNDGRVRKYNALFTAQNGRLCSTDKSPYPFCIKTLHPNYREFDDTRHFYSLRKLAQDMGKSIGELLQPINITIDGKLFKIGGILCEDGWSDDYSFDPLAALHAKGPLDLVVNISSSPFTLGKNNKRNRVFSKQARVTGVPLAYVNNVGLQNNGKTVYTFDGSSSLYDAQGNIVAQCPSFQPDLKIVDIGSNANASTAVIIPETQEIGSIYQALTYGVNNFMQQIGMKKVVIGVSGGIDSAVNAALFTCAVGPENILLANMPSIYNSQTTKGLSEKLASNLGCQYTIIPIQETVNHTVSQITTSPIIDLKTGQESKLAVSSFMTENIQARDRSGRILAGLSAAFGGGFTCNANKTELTVGYSTLYGDQAGFIAAIGDLWKHQVYALGQYLNAHIFQSEVIPQGIFDIVPSAELSSEQAVDEGKGDPLIYPYHDYLFRSFMEWWNRATPEDILTWYAADELDKQLGCKIGLTKQIFATPEDFIRDLERWWKLYTGMGVAKRIQAPPILAISRRAYGFDHREAQNPPYFTSAYRKLKSKLLSGR
ncbi:MAG: hypothetical protein H6Q73_1271 [Firmicutes bacterium]|nr:hypothetical protein [Bacillota bacterium]